MAGTGKTSISKTVCEQASEDVEVLLGGSFFCSRSTGLAAQRDIRCVIPTLAQLLARDSVDFRLALAETIHNDIPHKEVAMQVEQLLRTPLSAIKDEGVPILFVIDALDECGGETADGMLDDTKCHAVVTSMLEALVKLTRSEPKLPVKFLVTSRPRLKLGTLLSRTTSLVRFFDFTLWMLRRSTRISGDTSPKLSARNSLPSQSSWPVSRTLKWRLSSSSVMECS